MVTNNGNTEKCQEVIDLYITLSPFLPTISYSNIN